MAGPGLPAVAIVGRPNVGKSTLFNRLLARRHAIVSELPGVTRDRLEAICQWAGREFQLVDTGGLVAGDMEPLAVQVRRQAERAIAESQVLVFVVDAAAGLTAQDGAIADVLRRSHRPVLIVANKTDAPGQTSDALEFHALGLGEPLPVSAMHGLGIGDLLDALVAALPPSGEEAAADDPVRVAFLGRPNVGKSSLVNAVLGEDRVIVDPRPGTTRDAVDTLLRYDGRPMLLVDTAGLRRRSRVSDGVEYYSTRRTHAALSRADVAVLVIDVGEGITDQDQRIARLIYEAGAGMVVALNKTDLLRGVTAAEIRKVAEQKLQFWGALELCPTVATSGEGVGGLMSAVLHVAEARRTRIATGPLNRLVDEALRGREPPADASGRRLHIYYATQPTTGPPAIVLFVNDPRLLTTEYRRYLERRLRETFDLTGTPLRLLARGRRPSASTRSMS